MSELVRQGAERAGERDHGLAKMVHQLTYSLAFIYHTMGLLQYEWANETHIVHFCKHLVIKDREPEDYDTVSGSWYVKEPRERGREISASRII